MRSDRTQAFCWLLLATVAQGGCAGEDAAAEGDGVPAFGQFQNPPVGQSAGAAGNGGAAVNGNAPAGSAGSAPAPQGSAGATNEGNLVPVGLDPSAGGAGNGAGGAGAVAAAGASLGGSAAVNEGGAAGALAAGGSENVGGSGMTPPDEPEPTEPTEAASSCPASALFCDDFEDDASGQFPGAPWQDNTAGGATVQVDGVQAFSGERAVHVNAPPNQAFRRGYFSLEQGSSNVFPAVSQEMFGRAMMFLDATPNAVVHWTIIQAEGRAASGTHDAYYRYGGQQQGGSGIMANYETNSGVSTDCYSHSATRMPVQRWACVEWHFDVSSNEMQLWLDGTELTDMHVVDRPATAGSGCLGNAVNGQWLAPPAFTTLHLGWENYQVSSNDRNLWVDDVAIGTERMGCPAP